jgi:hypothetical protein
LDWYIQAGDEFFDQLQIAVLTGEGGIQVHYMQTVTALFFPAGSIVESVLRINRTLIDLTLPEADHLAVQEIDSGENDHESELTKV